MVILILNNRDIQLVWEMDEKASTDLILEVDSCDTVPNTAPNITMGVIMDEDDGIDMIIKGGIFWIVRRINRGAHCIFLLTFTTQ